MISDNQQPTTANFAATRVPRISVVTPTLRRPQEVGELLRNLAAQTLSVFEFILVDGAPEGEEGTNAVAEREFKKASFPCRYIRHGGGTAIQRNVGIEAARGDFIAFIDDDIRLEPEFFKVLLQQFSCDSEKKIGAIVGVRVNQKFQLEERQRWRWYRRLRLLSTFEPGRYDFKTGYPINATMNSSFSGVREVDFMTTSCAMWRREVMDEGLRFDPFFRDYGVLEDAHFSLRAQKHWRLLQCGDAHCRHEHSLRGRVNRRKIGYKCVVNYYFVFTDVAGPLTKSQKYRFWRYQLFELIRLAISSIRRMRLGDLSECRGRLEGMWAVLRGKAFNKT